MSSPRWPATSNDLGLAEELAQEALVDALRQWPRDGTPANPGAWLTAVGKRKAIDLFRRDRTLAAKYAQLGSGARAGGPDRRWSAGRRRRRRRSDDDRLRLIFVACHPLLPVPARVALTLRLVGGLTTAEIARAYVVPEPTIAQRIVRAKRTIAKAGVPFEVPEGDDRAARLGVGARGHLPDLQRGLLGHRRRGLAAPRAVRRSAAPRAASSPPWSPKRPRSMGSSRLMEFHSSRLRARVGPDGCRRRARRPGPAQVGPAAHQPGRGGAGAGPTSSRRHHGALHPASRDRRCATPAPSGPRRPTGPRW